MDTKALFAVLLVAGLLGGFSINEYLSMRKMGIYTLKMIQKSLLNKLRLVVKHLILLLPTPMEMNSAFLIMKGKKYWF